ncbi:MAG: hypothetical protein BGP04_14385 [Rhizobiales bacterium 62-17]|nr:hypothetical protein [Hyphomicrobiales bacterium]OJY02992.1 MAG: hypothetical protein BGP04_14385 [Rhizobiales bacterium 62-17]
MSQIRVEPGEDMLGFGCACCGSDGGVRGFIYDNEDPLAIYYAEAGGMSNMPVVLVGIAMGAWEAGTTKSQRTAIVFACSKPDNAPRQTVPTTPFLLGFPEFPLLGETIEPEVAPEHKDYARLLELCDALIDNDARFMHLRNDPVARRRFVADAPSAEP